ncbi:MAG: tetratricopeptide repeat protein, partial [Candidatus Omnitrophota bacterium]
TNGAQGTGNQDSDSTNGAQGTTNTNGGGPAGLGTGNGGNGGSSPVGAGSGLSRNIILFANTGLSSSGAEEDWLKNTVAFNPNAYAKAPPIGNSSSSINSLSSILRKTLIGTTAVLALLLGTPAIAEAAKLIFNKETGYLTQIILEKGDCISKTLEGLRITDGIILPPALKVAYYGIKESAVSNFYSLLHSLNNKIIATKDLIFEGVIDIPQSVGIQVKLTQVAQPAATQPPTLPVDYSWLHPAGIFNRGPFDYEALNKIANSYLVKKLSWFGKFIQDISFATGLSETAVLIGLAIIIGAIIGLGILGTWRLVNSIRAKSAKSEKTTGDEASLPKPAERSAYIGNILISFKGHLRAARNSLKGILQSVVKTVNASWQAVKARFSRGQTKDEAPKAVVTAPEAISPASVAERSAYIRNILISFKGHLRSAKNSLRGILQSVLETVNAGWQAVKKGLKNAKQLIKAKFARKITDPQESVLTPAPAPAPALETEVDQQFTAEDYIREAGARIVSGEYNEAITASLKAINLNPNLPEAYRILYDAYKATGKDKDAIRAWQLLQNIQFEEKYREIQVEAEHKFDVAQIYLRVGDKDQAIKLFQEAIQVYPRLADRLPEEVRNQVLSARGVASPISKVPASGNIPAAGLPIITSSPINKLTTSFLGVKINSLKKDRNYFGEQNQSSSSVQLKATGIGISNRPHAPPFASIVNWFGSIFNKGAKNGGENEEQRNGITEVCRRDEVIGDSVPNQAAGGIPAGQHGSNDVVINQALYTGFLSIAIGLAVNTYGNGPIGSIFLGFIISFALLILLNIVQARAPNAHKPDASFLSAQVNQIPKNNFNLIRPSLPLTVAGMVLAVLLLSGAAEHLLQVMTPLWFPIQHKQGGVSWLQSSLASWYLITSLSLTKITQFSPPPSTVTGISGYFLLMKLTVMFILAMAAQIPGKSSLALILAPSLAVLPMPATGTSLCTRLTEQVRISRDNESSAASSVLVKDTSKQVNFSLEKKNIAAFVLAIMISIHSLVGCGDLPGNESGNNISPYEQEAYRQFARNIAEKIELDKSSFRSEVHRKGAEEYSLEICSKKAKETVEILRLHVEIIKKYASQYNLNPALMFGILFAEAYDMQSYEWWTDMIGAWFGYNTSCGLPQIQIKSFRELWKGKKWEQYGGKTTERLSNYKIAKLSDVPEISIETLAKYLLRHKKLVEAYCVKNGITWTEDQINWQLSGSYTTGRDPRKLLPRYEIYGEKSLENTPSAKRDLNGSIYALHVENAMKLIAPVVGLSGQKIIPPVAPLNNYQERNVPANKPVFKRSNSGKKFTPGVGNKYKPELSRKQYRGAIIKQQKKAVSESKKSSSSALINAVELEKTARLLYGQAYWNKIIPVEKSGSKSVSSPSVAGGKNSLLLNGVKAYLKSIQGEFHRILKDTYSVYPAEYPHCCNPGAQIIANLLAWKFTLPIGGTIFPRLELVYGESRYMNWSNYWISQHWVELVLSDTEKYYIDGLSPAQERTVKSVIMVNEWGTEEEMFFNDNYFRRIPEVFRNIDAEKVARITNELKSYKSSSSISNLDKGAVVAGLSFSVASIVSYLLLYKFSALVPLSVPVALMIAGVLLIIYGLKAKPLDEHTSVNSIQSKSNDR